MTDAQPNAVPDADTVYNVTLTGRQIDGIARIFDEVCRNGGLGAAVFIVPLLEAITAERKVAMAAAAKPGAA